MCKAAALVCQPHLISGVLHIREPEHNPSQAALALHGTVPSHSVARGRIAIHPL